MRKLATLLYTLLLTTSSAAVFAQSFLNESNYWYFGDAAGIRFLPPGPNGRPVALSDANPMFNAFEGAAAISTPDGRLIAYFGSVGGINGDASVVNRAHQIMANGDNVYGGSSCTQNGMFVRKPSLDGRDTSTYYVFSVAEIENWGGLPGDNGFYYTVIKLDTLNGLGAVISKNNVIVDTAAEKVTAVLHNNGRDVWVLGHKFNSRDFVAVLVDTSGPRRPVISRVGMVHGDLSGNNQVGSRGAMKLSPNGNRIAACITEGNPGTNDRHIVQVAQFDNISGAVYNVFHIDLGPDAGFGPFGVEFSPDNSKLYVGDRSSDEVYQFDLCAGTGLNDTNAIKASQTTVSNWGGTEPGCLQLGLDGVIYISKVFGGANSLAAITNPNGVGAACGFTADYLPLAPGTSADRGLTNVNQSIFNDLAGTLEFTRLCERDTVLFSGQAQCQGVQARYYWNFGDTLSGANNIDTVNQFPKHFYAVPGKYRVRLRIVSGNIVDTVSELITITPLPRGRIIYDDLACKQNYRYSFVQDTTDPFDVDVTNYTWKIFVTPGDTVYSGTNLSEIEFAYDSNQTVRYVFYAESTTSLGETCISDSIEFNVLVNQIQGQRPEGPDTVCFDPAIPVVLTSPDSPRAEYQWVFTPSSDPARIEGQGTNTINYYAATPGPKTAKTTFYLDTTNRICYTESPIKRFFVAAAPADSIFITGDSSICEDPSSLFTSFGKVPTSTITWTFTSNTGSGNATFPLGNMGDSVRALFSDLAVGRNLYSINAQEISKDGCPGKVYSKEVWNACLSYTNFVSPNGDGNNDVFKIGNIENFTNNEIVIYNRWGRKVVEAKSFNNSTNPVKDLPPGTYFYKSRIFWEGRNVENKGWFDVNK